MVNPINITSNKQTKQTKQKLTANTKQDKKQHKTQTQNKSKTKTNTTTKQIKTKQFKVKKPPCERELKIDHTGASHQWRQGGNTLWQSKIHREI